MSKSELATFDKISAGRVRKDAEFVQVVVAGENPASGYEMSLPESMLPIVPPQYSLLRRTEGYSLPVVTPYRFSTLLRIPEGVDAIVVHHEGGRAEVSIEEAWPELDDLARIVAPAAEQAAGGVSEAIGFSESMSFDEAFDDAIMHLPGMVSIHPDSLVAVEVVDSGALLGGSAGLHLFYVRIRGGRVG